MKTLRIPSLMIMTLALCVAPLAAVPGSTPEGAEGRLVQDLGITEDGSYLTLSWAAVPEAEYYVVYSSEYPELGFTEDMTGSFDGTTWTAPFSGNSRFYFVTSVTSDTPAGFVYVPAGTFAMGDTHSTDYPNELPIHSVTLDPFYIGEYEVTQAEWQAMMGSNPAQYYGVGDDYPVYYVSWYAVLKYCNLRSIGEGLAPVYSISGSTDPADWGDVPTSSNAIWNAANCDWEAGGYRLPTEAEWEYAARGAAINPDYLYSGSDNIFDVAWHWVWGGTNESSHIVGELDPNGLGAFDMSGNIYEWCWDWWGYDYYSNSPHYNPTGPSSGPARVLRGGSWEFAENYCRVSSRNNGYPQYSYSYTGFRLCRSLN